MKNYFMIMNNIEDFPSWITQPDVCRCCLSVSGVFDLTALYITDTGDREVFGDTLNKIFGITLSHLSEWGSNKLICEICVNQIRKSSDFHKQVCNADTQFSKYWNNRREIIEKKLPEQTNYICKSQIVDSKGEKANNDIDYDSDTPIAKIKNNMYDNNLFEVSDCEGDKINHDENRLNLHVDKVKNYGIEETVSREKLLKKISERKRVILTCGTVLRETTACPFRHHKSWFQCFFCSQDFMEIDSLRDHTLKSHSDIENELKKIKRYPRSLQIEISELQCRNCHLNLTDVNIMKQHFVEKHNKIIYNECIADYKVNSSPYTCHLCKREFHVFRTLTTHLNEHYANFICDVCGKSFLNIKRLKVHKRTHENGLYPCNECGKVLKTKISKANHMESIHSKRIIKCQICYKPMKHYNDRIKHMSEVHNITHKFKCPICSREYNIKHYLATHIRQTHGHKNKKCSECGMAFITNHGLKKHMSKHTGERPFSCNICCKSYARSYSLREHMKAHDNDKLLDT